MGNQKTVEVVNDPWATTNDNRGRLYVRGKGNGYWPVDSSIFDGWEWSRPNASAMPTRCIRLHLACFRKQATEQDFHLLNAQGEEIADEPKVIVP